jgi:5-formyltetrahydrofolate cyclo-ligase
MSETSTVDRKALRRRLLDARVGLDDAAHTAFSTAITTALLTHLRPLVGRVFAAYWPHRREYDPMKLAEQIIAEGGAIALPVVVEKGKPLEFRQWHPDTEMLVGLYEIPHPAGDTAVVPDVVLAPVVGFDQAGYRLGYGSGYYDRTIAALPTRPLLVGVGFELGRVETIAPQPHDIPMDLIVTELGVFRPAGGMPTRIG